MKGKLIKARAMPRGYGVHLRLPNGTPVVAQNSSGTRVSPNASVDVIAYEDGTYAVVGSR